LSEHSNRTCRRLHFVGTTIGLACLLHAFATLNFWWLLAGLVQGYAWACREYIERLTTVDFTRDMALAAALMLDGREVLIGVARYVLEPDGRACEFALVVADDWQGRGIGRRLLEKLIAVARRRGLARMYGASGWAAIPTTPPSRARRSTWAERRGE
jgi:GNAT superfamily N-acetyltransferase